MPKKKEIGSGYSIIYYHRIERKKPPMKMGIVKYLSRDALLFTIINDKYAGGQKDCYLLHQEPEIIDEKNYIMIDRNYIMNVFSESHMCVIIV